MNKKYIWVLLIIAMICPSLFAGLEYNLNKNDTSVLVAGSNMIQVDMGFDNEMKIYTFVDSSKDIDLSKRKGLSEFYTLIDSTDPIVVEKLFVAVQSNLEISKYLYSYYSSKKKWNYANFIKKKSIPGNDLVSKAFLLYASAKRKNSSIIDPKDNQIISVIRKNLLSQMARVEVVGSYQ